MTRHIVIEDLPPAAKGRASEIEALSADDAQTPALFEALVYPNRSLPNTGFMMVMAVVIAANIVFGAYFFILGAWPVIGFCGLDVFLVWLAFKISYRQGRLHERVRISEDAIIVSRVLPSGHETRWRLHPYWTRVEIDRPVEHESQLQLVSKGRRLVLGAFLSPPERGDLACAIESALRRARGAAA